MTTTFYAPPAAFNGMYVELPDDEARHAVKVLRMQPGDELVVVDGVGRRHRVVLTEASKQRAVGQVLETEQEVDEAAVALTLGLALLKNRNRFETALEKAVELGVRRIIPLMTARTEKGGLKTARAENILVAAMKQSGRCRLPDLAAPTDFTEALTTEADLALIAHEDAAGEHGIFRVLKQHPFVHRVRVLVGPEGGFTDEEVAQAQAAGYQLASLGPRRLRAETAAITAAAAVMLWNECGGAA